MVLNPMTAPDLSRLERLAREAAPGQRKFEPHPYGYGYSVLWVPETRAEILVTGGRNDGDDPITWMGEELSDADREFIEAANPAAVLALFTMWQAAEAKLQAIRDECDGKEDADDGIPNTAMRCMMIVEGTNKP